MPIILSALHLGLLQPGDEFNARPKLAAQRLAGRATPETPAPAQLQAAVQSFTQADDHPLLNPDGPNWYRGAALCNEVAEADVLNRRTPADIFDADEIVRRANGMSAEFGRPIAPGLEALVYKASRGIEDIAEMTCVRKDGTRLPAVVSVTALRDAHDGIIGYLLVGTDNTARKRAEELAQ